MREIEKERQGGYYEVTGGQGRTEVGGVSERKGEFGGGGE